MKVWTVCHLCVCAASDRGQVLSSTSTSVSSRAHTTSLPVLTCRLAPSFTLEIVLQKPLSAVSKSCPFRKIVFSHDSVHLKLGQGSVGMFWFHTVSAGLTGIGEPKVVSVTCLEPWCCLAENSSPGPLLSVSSYRASLSTGPVCCFYLLLLLLF